MRRWMVTPADKAPRAVSEDKLATKLEVLGESYVQCLRPGIVDVIDGRVLVRRRARQEPREHIEQGAYPGQPGKRRLPSFVFHRRIQLGRRFEPEQSSLALNTGLICTPPL